jgi:hypothetical protein
MADDPSKRAPQDRYRIHLSRDYEVRYWSEKFGVTGADLRDAIKKVGNSAKAVENELAGRPPIRTLVSRHPGAARRACL